MRRINRWFCQKKKKPATHLLLDGGTLSVPNDDESLYQFFEDYIQDVLSGSGERLCVVENKTVPHFRFFVDVDYVGECELDYVKITECLHEIVGLGPCVLARAKPRDTPKGKKTGMHILWPESVVTKQRANSIRLRIIEHMGPEWVSVFDPSVYAGSGLRMLWSLKNEEGSTPYIPWGVCSEAGVFKEFENKSPSVAYLKMFSIRVAGACADTAAAGADTGVILTKESLEELQEFIQKNVPGQDKTKLLRITKWKKSEDYCITSDSKYCENVKRCHKGNHVCFRLTKNGILSQRCNDDECKGFKNARLYRIPSRLIPNEGVLDSRTHRTIYDYLPNGWKK